MEKNISVVISEEDLRRRVRELGAEISRDYAGRTPVLVAVLKGSFVFLADLVARDHRPGQPRLHGDHALRRRQARRRGAHREGPRPGRSPAARCCSSRTSSTPA